MAQLLNPLLLYLACAVGAVGVMLALPRKGVNPQLIGAVVGAGALGAVLVGLAIRYPEAIPNYHFYIFSLVALGAALRVISHPRPVYAALYFVLTILASCGLYVILAAEFMAFALVIVYAGAILITYLFVIMLATEAPTAEQVEALAEYDRVSREPILASLAGFLLLAGLTTMLWAGAATLPVPDAPDGMDRLAMLPRKIERTLERDGIITPDETIRVDPASGRAVRTPEGAVVADGAGGASREIPPSLWPADLRLENVEGVAFGLLSEHPAAIEIAGVVLLMAMLGAVVLARMKVDIDERSHTAPRGTLAPPGDAA